MYGVGEHCLLLVYNMQYVKEVVANLFIARCVVSLITRLPSTLDSVSPSAHEVRNTHTAGRLGAVEQRPSPCMSDCAVEMG